MARRQEIENRDGFWSRYVHRPTRRAISTGLGKMGRGEHLDDHRARRCFASLTNPVARSYLSVGCLADAAKRTQQSGMASLVVAARFRDRLAGFLVPRPPNCLLLIAPCHSIHTFGMKEDLDVAFFDRNGTVLLARECVGPTQIVRCSGAYGVLERRSVNGQWYRTGETLRVAMKASRERKR